MTRKIIKLVLVIAWMGLIFSFSSDNGDVSTKKSDSFILSIVELFYDRELSSNEEEKWITYLVTPVRKGAHFFVYLVLGILICNYLIEYINIGNKLKIMSILGSFIYACSDEVHQLLVPGRSGQISDVLLDTIGASIGVLLFTFIIRKWKKNEQEERVS